MKTAACSAWSFTVNWRVPQCYLKAAPATVNGIDSNLDSGSCSSTPSSPPLPPTSPPRAAPDEQLQGTNQYYCQLFVTPITSTSRKHRSCRSTVCATKVCDEEEKEKWLIAIGWLQEPSTKTAKSIGRRAKTA